FHGVGPFAAAIGYDFDGQGPELEEALSHRMFRCTGVSYATARHAELGDRSDGAIQVRGADHDVIESDDTVGVLHRMRLGVVGSIRFDEPGRQAVDVAA